MKFLYLISILTLFDILQTTFSYPIQQISTSDTFSRKHFIFNQFMKTLSMHTTFSHMIKNKQLQKLSTPPKLTKNNDIFQNVLVISCGKAGSGIIQQIQTNFKDANICIATTKQKRTRELKNIANEVVVIPQIDTSIEQDYILREAIQKSDVVILADTIKIFSVHTFYRTCVRIRKLVDSIPNWNGKLGLISSENAYGAALAGQILTETSDIFPNPKFPTNENFTVWHVNPYNLAMIIRMAENQILNGPQSSVVLRTSGIWDNDKFMNAFLFTRGRHFPYHIKDSYLSFSTVKTIGKAMLWAMVRNKKGVYNVAEMGTLGLTREMFYEKIHLIYGKNKIKEYINEDIKKYGEYLNQQMFDPIAEHGIIWDRDLPFDEDKLFCMDPDPYLPSSQRSNSQLSCQKLINEGFRF